MTQAIHSDDVQVADLEIGVSAETDLFDSHGTLMIPQGTLVTGLLIGKLIRNGVESLSLAKPTKSKAARQTPQQQATPTAADGREKIERAANDALSSYPREKLNRVQKLMDEATTIVGDLASRILETGKIDIREANPVVQKMVQELADDADPVVAAQLVRQADMDLAKRCVQFSTLALAVGKRMRLPSREIYDLGRVGLTHDWVLFELPPNQRFVQQTRDDAAQSMYIQHPIQAEALMAHSESGTATLATMTGQVHELLDGSGFPRKTRADAIHPLSRVLTVIDTYLTLTSPPDGQPRIVPGDAIAYLVAGMSSGKFAPTAVSGILETMSLYPIGSVVELSDQSRVRTIRTNDADYGYPIVQDIDEPSRQINLKESDLFVTRPIAVTEFGEMRLPDPSSAKDDSLE